MDDEVTPRRAAAAAAAKQALDAEAGAYPRSLFSST
jgi:hypothetical protein